MLDFLPSSLLRARFIERPNRFLVIVEIDGRRQIRAMMPNPGRMAELLLPGAILYLSDDGATDGKGTKKAATGRRTRYTVWAVERDGRPVFLHTHKTNDVARYLLERKRISGLESCEIVRAEAPHGRSRFDFLMRETGPRGDKFFLEVKSVTLFGNGAAMFPDAVTDRGRRHLLELAEIGRKAEAAGRPKPVVFFLVHTDRVDRFLPDYHTDPAFARALLEVRDAVRILPVSIRWTPALRIGRQARLLDVPWEFIDREARDRGAYLLLLKLKKTRRIEVGHLGFAEFPEGWHVYVGSAMRNLSARVARHLRKRKNFHWHIDYLRNAADDCVALPIRSSRREECEIANALEEILPPGPTGFGCSDCRCPTHLFLSETNPLHRQDFHVLLERFRMPFPPPEDDSPV